MWFNVRSLHSSSWLNVNTIATFLNTIKQFTSVCGLFIWQHLLVCFKIPLSTEVLIFQKQKIPWQIKLPWADCSLSCFSRPLAGTFGGTLLFQGSKFSSGVGFFPSLSRKVLAQRLMLSKCSRDFGNISDWPDFSLRWTRKQWADGLTRSRHGGRYLMISRLHYACGRYISSDGSSSSR